MTASPDPADAVVAVHKQTPAGKDDHRYPDTARLPFTGIAGRA